VVSPGPATAPIFDPMTEPATKPATEKTKDALAHGGLQGRRDVLWETTLEALSGNDTGTLRLVLNSQHPVDLADLLSRLGDDDRPRCLSLLAEALAAGVLAEFGAPTALSVAEELDDQSLLHIVAEMAPDDADEVRELMEHPDDTGGGIMTSRLVAVTEDANVGDVIDLLRAGADDAAEEPMAVFVVDAEGRLVGSVSLYRLLLAGHTEALRAVADYDPIIVRADMDQEEIAEIFADFDLLALPVVDVRVQLVGQVTVDDIVDVIQQEATEDNLKMAATSSHEMEERSVVGIMRRRLPWLLFCLVGTLLSGALLDLISGILTLLSPLVLFVPAIMAMGGNSGIQTSTVTVRSLATGIFHPNEVGRTLWREVRVAAGMGLFLGIAVFAVAHLWTGGSLVAPYAGIAMFAAVLLSAVAVVSGHLITTVNDILSLGIYFGVATALLRLLGPA
jgi:magnesium transporter